MSEEEKPKDKWDKAKIIASIIAVIIIPLVIGFSGHVVSIALKNQESETKMVELAVVILTKPPDNSESEVRNWALDVITKYSGVSLSEKGREYLKTNPIIRNSSESFNFFASNYPKLLEESIEKAAGQIIDANSYILIKIRERTPSDKRSEYITADLAPAFDPL